MPVLAAARICSKSTGLELLIACKRFLGLAAVVHPERIKCAAVLTAVKVGPGNACVAGRLWRAGRP